MAEDRPLPEGGHRGIPAPTLITFGRYDQATSMRFAEPLSNQIRNSEVLVFEARAPAPIYEKVEEFNQMTLQFLQRHTGGVAAPLTGHD